MEKEIGIFFFYVVVIVILLLVEEWFLIFKIVWDFLRILKFLIFSYRKIYLYIVYEDL